MANKARSVESHQKKTEDQAIPDRKFTIFKSAVIIFIVLTLFALPTISFIYIYNLIFPEKTIILSNGPTVEAISKLKELVTLRVRIGDVLTGKKEGWLNGAQLALVVSGDALISVDLTKSIISVDKKTRTAQIGIVKPRLLMARVDHQKTSIYDLKSTSYLPWPFPDGKKELMQECMAKAQNLIEQAANSEDNINQAKDQAEMIIKQLYSELGWTINIDWISP